MTVPTPVGVNEREQVDVVALTFARVHGPPLKLPAAVPVLTKATLPIGADGVPTDEVSLTNAVHDVD
jgi:hypothetical protein